EVVQGEAMPLVPAGDGDDEAQGGGDEPVLREEVAALDALGELDLLRRLQELIAVRPLQELLERVGVDVALVVFEDLLLGSRLGQDPPDGYPMVALGIIPSFGCTCNRWAGAGHGGRRRISRVRARGRPAGRARTAGDLLMVPNIRSECREVRPSRTHGLCSSPTSSKRPVSSERPPRAARRSPTCPPHCAASLPRRSPRASRSCPASCASGSSASAGRRCATRPAQADRPPT